MLNAAEINSGPDIRVLLVDDDDVDRESLSRMLNGYKQPLLLQQAASVGEAIEALAKHCYDCVIVDYNLGDGEGLDLIPFVHRHCGKDCPIILVTGLGSECRAVHAIKSGVYDYIPKGELTCTYLLGVLENSFGWSATQKQLDAAEREIRHRSMFDTLTELPNRDLFHDRLNQAMEAYERFAMPFGILLMDLDHFKEVNDTLGHSVGDQVLREAAARLSSAFRSVDTVARLGGDEFVAMLPGVDNLETAFGIATKVVDKFRAQILVDGHSLLVGISVGIALCPQSAINAKELLALADKSMYEAKKSLGRIVCLSGDAVHDGKPPQALIGDIQRAIDQGELVMHYQPKIAFETGVVTGFEALVRWQRTPEELVLPEQFIPAVEDSSLLSAFTFLTLKLVIMQLARWREAGHKLSVAVNISSRMLEDHSLVETVVQLLDKYQLPRDALTLEITETTLIVNPLSARNIIQRLKAFGIRIAIDDFGAGFTSFHYLKDFAVDEIKLDHGFVLNLTERGFDASLIKSMAVLCEGLNTAFIAEGVETEAIAQTLYALGCKEGQGFYAARPMPAEQVLGWLERWVPPTLAS